MNRVIRGFTRCATRSGYWKGPYQINVPDHITSIVAHDGRNILYKNGGSTEIGVPNPLPKDNYLEKYATLEDNGEYYWKEQNAVSKKE